MILVLVADYGIETFVILVGSFGVLLVGRRYVLDWYLLYKYKYSAVADNYVSTLNSHLLHSGYLSISK